MTTPTASGIRYTQRGLLLESIMAKKQEQKGTLYIITTEGLREIVGTLVEQTADYIAVDAKRPRKDPERVLIPVASIQSAFIAEGEDGCQIYVKETITDEYKDVVLDETTGGWFTGHTEEYAVMVRPGTWKFVLTDDEKPAAKGKGKAAPAKEEAEEKPAAKGKGKAPAKEEEYEPAVGDNVRITFADGETEDVVGEVEAVTPKVITVGGEKYKFADIESVVQEDAEGGDEYEPAEGDYVSVTDAEENVVEGTITALNAKKVTVTDADEEEHVFVISKVVIEKAEPPKKKEKASKKPTKEADADDSADDDGDDKPAKGKGKGTPKAAEVKGGGKKAAKEEEEGDDDW